MNEDLNNRLKYMREKASLEEAKYSYIASISNLFLRFPPLLSTICQDIGIGEEELVRMLENDETDLSFLDHLMELLYNKEKTRGKVKEASMNPNGDFPKF